MDVKLRKSFSELKSKCKTKSQRLAFNELVKTFSDSSFIKDTIDVYTPYIHSSAMDEIANNMGADKNDYWLCFTIPYNKSLKEVWRKYLTQEPKINSTNIKINNHDQPGILTIYKLKSGKYIGEFDDDSDVRTILFTE